MSAEVRLHRNGQRILIMKEFPALNTVPELWYC